MWSTASTYTFMVSLQPSFTVQSADTSISKTNIDILKTTILNTLALRGLDNTDFIGTITKGSSQITKSHLDATRTKAEILSNVIDVVPTWTDPVITKNTTIRKGTHWIEIFNSLKQC